MSRWVPGQCILKHFSGYWDLSRIIYIIVGVAGVWTLLFVLPKMKK